MSKLKIKVKFFYIIWFLLNGLRQQSNIILIKKPVPKVFENFKI